MKISLSKARHECGLIWLVIFIFMAAALLAALIYVKLSRTVRDADWDITHGNTNLLDEGVALLHEQFGSNATIRVPELNNLELPIDALAYEWRELVHRSTNLIDWTAAEITWAEALEDVGTNQVLPQLFYRRSLWVTP